VNGPFRCNATRIAAAANSRVICQNDYSSSALPPATSTNIKSDVNEGRVFVPTSTGAFLSQCHVEVEWIHWFWERRVTVNGLSRFPFAQNPREIPMSHHKRGRGFAVRAKAWPRIFASDRSQRASIYTPIFPSPLPGVASARHSGRHHARS